MVGVDKRSVGSKQNVYHERTGTLRESRTVNGYSSRTFRTKSMVEEVLLRELGKEERKGWTDPKTTVLFLKPTSRIPLSLGDVRDLSLVTGSLRGTTGDVPRTSVPKSL